MAEEKPPKQQRLKFFAAGLAGAGGVIIPEGVVVDLPPASAALWLARCVAEPSDESVTAQWDGDKLTLLPEAAAKPQPAGKQPKHAAPADPAPTDGG